MFFEEEKIIDIPAGYSARLHSETDPEKTLVVGIINVSPEIGNSLLNNEEDERKANKAYVKQYARDMKEGRWELNGEPVILDKAGKRVNGHQRVLAGQMAETNFETLVVEGVSESAKLTVDQGSPRTINDQVKIRGFNSLVGAALKGVKYLKKEDRDEEGGWRRLTLRELDEELSISPELYKAAGNFAAKIYYYYPLLSKKAIATSYVYLVREKNVNPSTVEKFFEEGVDDPEGSVLGTLVESLNARKIDGSKGGVNYTVQQAMMMAAWNFWVRGEHPDMISYSNRDSDFVKPDKGA